MSCASFRKYGNPAEFCQTVLALSPSGWVRPLNSRKRRILSQNCGFCWAVIGFWPPWFSHGYIAALHCSAVEKEAHCKRRYAPPTSVQPIFCGAHACSNVAHAVTSYSQLSRTPSFSANWATEITDSTRYLGSSLSLLSLKLMENFDDLMNFQADIILDYAFFFQTGMRHVK